MHNYEVVVVIGSDPHDLGLKDHYQDNQDHDLDGDLRSTFS